MSQVTQGFNSIYRQRTLCDICGKARNRGNHKPCAEARKQRGFKSE